jgi:hypothetical protein
MSALHDRIFGARARLVSTLLGSTISTRGGVHGLLHRGLLYGPRGQLIATVWRWPAATSSIRWSRPRSRWYVVRDRVNVMLEARALAANSDLKRVLVAAMLERIDAGWRIGESSSKGRSFFCTRGTERC